MLKEMPEVGDKVRYVGHGHGYDNLVIGGIYEIKGHDEDGDAYFEVNPRTGMLGFIQDSHGINNFNKFELIREDKEEERSPKNDRDLIIELAQSVAQLTKKVDVLEANIESIDNKAEMLIDDVVMLDERTRPVEKPEAKPEVIISKDTSRIDAILKGRSE